jgi:hypothetical protein
MKRLLLLLVLIGMAVGCTGCQQYWYREGVNFANARRDLQQCRAEATKRADPDNVFSDYPIRYEKHCMFLKGYQLVKEDELPIEVRREDADITEWEKFGIAGTID